MLTSYFSDLMAIVDNYGGDVIKFAGDALMIVWVLKANHYQTGKIGRKMTNMCYIATLCALKLIK